MADLRLITYCGLYCGLCAEINRIPRIAQDLRDTMKKEGYDQWGQNLPGFKEFWSFLNNLIESKTTRSCREGTCGAPFCSIRKCAREKNVDICIYCEDYPCNRIDGIAQGYPTLLTDGKRLKDIGVDAWIVEQEQRAKTGFTYADIRCYPYEVPDK